ncbi:ribosome biogenesis GTPase Der [Candidatus Poribacteria bacterium]|nr:ribosome biogenesis GTPase Der [Candidatus Poribacteria bacterium]MYK16618.1 ribosome biogenesis GTPase Der [Candidatus Poribacteria bacterium]
METGHPIVAIVGRPNVGKSSLFNRITASVPVRPKQIRTDFEGNGDETLQPVRPRNTKKSRKFAVVHDTPGVTRDRNYADVEWNDRTFTIVDTGGLDVDPNDRLIDNVQLQVDTALDEASLVLFVVDARAGVMPHDMTVANKLRTSGKPIFLVVNKVDSDRFRNEAAEFYALGFSEPTWTSCVQNDGIRELLDRVVEELPDTAATSDSASAAMKIAIVGRPNVGKSSLINNLLGEERMIVDDRPGTTRDAVNIRIVHDNIPFEVVDTAGMRRKSAINDELESVTVQRAIHSIRQSDIAVLVLDVTQEIAQQDKTIANFIERQGKASVLVLNKWDLVEKDNTTHPAFMDRIDAQLPQLHYVPRVFVSALTGQRVTHILEIALEVYREYCTRIPTPDLNQLLLELRTAHPPPRVKGVRPALKYITQVEITPPTFLIFGRNLHRIRPPYEAYLANNIRAEFGFNGTPIRIFYRQS